MIPAQNIVAWGNVVPWADQRQVEQDLIISRALVEIFSDQMLRSALPRPFRQGHLAGTGPGAHVRQAGPVPFLARHAPIAAGRPSGSSDG